VYFLYFHILASLISHRIRGSPNSIKALILTDGLIETVDSAVLCGLSNMSVLVLSNNVIFTIMDNAFQNLTVLRTLLMDHNRITSQSLDRSTFSWLSKLEILQLGNNALRVIDGSWFQNSKALKALFLEGNLLTSLNSTSFGSSDLRNLETLGLSDNLITYVGQDSFHNLPRLRSLDLSRNRLQNAPNAFSYLSWLSLLNLDLNRWNCTCELRELASFLNSYIQSPRDQISEAIQYKNPLNSNIDLQGEGQAREQRNVTFALSGPMNNALIVPSKTPDRPSRINS
uniref:LRRCT domain-containing protein n=1 Tax=Electrophorus electricus TaxID=8005 RepID=A0A4W4FEI4_ELEEL